MCNLLRSEFYKLKKVSYLKIMLCTEIIIIVVIQIFIMKRPILGFTLKDKGWNGIFYYLKNPLSSIVCGIPLLNLLFHNEDIKGSTNMIIASGYSRSYVKFSKYLAMIMANSIFPIVATITAGIVIGYDRGLGILHNHGIFFRKLMISMLWMYETQFLIISLYDILKGTFMELIAMCILGIYISFRLIIVKQWQSAVICFELILNAILYMYIFMYKEKLH